MAFERKVHSAICGLFGSDRAYFENSLTIVDGASEFLHAQGTVDDREVNLQFSVKICVE